MRQWGALGRDCTWPSEEREGEVGGEAARGPRSAGCLGECEAHGSGAGAENAPDQSRAPRRSAWARAGERAGRA